MSTVIQQIDLALSCAQDEETPEIVVLAEMAVPALVEARAEIKRLTARRKQEMKEREWLIFSLSKYRDRWLLCVGERDEARAEVETHRAALTTPEGYRGVVADAVADELERLRARVAEMEAICNEPDPLPTELLAAQMDGDQRVVAMMRERDAALARVAELEARPTVHPLAWGRLRTESEYWNEDSGDRGLYSMRSALEYWCDEDCPLTATGGEVLVPGGRH